MSKTSTAKPELEERLRYAAEDAPRQVSDLLREAANEIEELKRIMGIGDEYLAADDDMELLMMEPAGHA